MARFTNFGFLCNKKYLVVTTGFHTGKALSCNQLVLTTNFGVFKKKKSKQLINKKNSTMTRS